MEMSGFILGFTRASTAMIDLWDHLEQLSRAEKPLSNGM